MTAVIAPARDRSSRRPRGCRRAASALAADDVKWQIPDGSRFIEEIPPTVTGNFKKLTLREMFVTATAN